MNLSEEDGVTAATPATAATAGLLLVASGKFPICGNGATDQITHIPIEFERLRVKLMQSC